MDRGCTLKEPESVFEFLSHGVNFTSWQKTTQHLSIPSTVTYAEISFYYSLAYILETGVRSEFRFITYHGLKQQDGMTLGALAVPFQTAVWACLGRGAAILVFESGQGNWNGCKNGNRNSIQIF